MKKAGIFCIRALCAIFVGAVLGCSGGGSDGEMSNPNGGSQTKVEHELVADICGEEHKCKVAGCTEHGYTHPAYMNVTNEFEGQRFVEAGKNWSNNSNGNQEFTTRYNDASTYIDCKVTELNNLLQEKNISSNLYYQINTALSNFNNGASIGDKINNNYTALAPVFVTLFKQYDVNNADDVKKYYQFQASYHKLAANAYNNSLGHLVNSPDNSVLTNKEMKNLSENSFVKELKTAGLNYDDFDVNAAKQTMKTSLNALANATNTDPAVLKKVIELALYNESLYGLNDLAKLDNVISRETLREHRFFDQEISLAYNKSRSIDDRTM